MMRLAHVFTWLSLVMAIVVAACQFSKLHARPVPQGRCEQKGLRF